MNVNLSDCLQLQKSILTVVYQFILKFDID